MQSLLFILVWRFALSMANGGGDESSEERIRLARLRTKFRVELHGDEPRMFVDFNGVDKLSVGTGAGEDESAVGELFFIV